MKLSDAQGLAKFLEAKGYEADVGTDYSGYGMQGTTAAVSTNANTEHMESMEEAMLDANINLLFNETNTGFTYIYY